MTDEIEIDRWLLTFDVGRALRDVERLTKRDAELDEVIRVANEERAEVQRKLIRTKTALALHGNTEVTLRVRPDESGSQADSTTETPERGRNAVRALMKSMPEVREWTIASVLEGLVKRGWAESGDEHAVSVSLSRMARAGELARPRRGVYGLPRPVGEAFLLPSDGVGRD